METWNCGGGNIDLHKFDIFDSLKNPVVIVDMEKRIRYLNRAYEEACGFRREECWGQHCSIFHTPFCYTEKCCIRKFEDQDESIIQPVDNHQQHLVSISRLYGEDGTQVGYISISTDISFLFKNDAGLKKQEAEYRHALTEIQKKYAEEKRYKDSLLSVALEAYEINLTRDTARLLPRSESPLSTEACQVWSFSALVAERGDWYVAPEFKNYYYTLLDRKSLMQAFEDGEREISGEYLRKSGEDTYIWVNLSLYFVKNEEGDLCACMYIKDIDEQKRREIDVKSKAEMDQLTSLLNRNAATQRIQETLSSSTSGLCALIMVDIDDFKTVNDTCGHVHGDAVLKEIAHTMRGLFRKEDVVGRLGGDEFIVFLSHIPDKTLAIERAEQLCRVIKDLSRKNDLLSRIPSISCSAGIAYAPTDGITFDSLYRKADKALYQAKDKGKNQYKVYEQ